ncbi:MAG TPA: ATP-dependent RecD-like DNA helicase [Planctomycetota bacterium]|jgi:exodeoxyribonuclease V alpha subunit
MQPPDHLSGTIDRIVFHSEDSGFCVLKVIARGQREPVSVIGTIPKVSAGEWIDAQGQWVVDPKHGQQFKAEMMRTTHPETAEGIEKYLASGMIKGIGPEFSRRLVERFGKDVFKVIDEHPERLREVPGIGTVRKERILGAWKEQKAVREIMVFLHSHGVGTSRAFRIYKTYGAQAIDKVREDPYCLARDIWGVGFKSADQIAMSLGVDKQSDLRARAGVAYVLQELTNDGHCAFPRPGLIKRAIEILQIPELIVEKAIAHEIQIGELVERPNGVAPASAPAGSDAPATLIYLAAMDAAERQLASHLVELARGTHPCGAINAAKAIAWVEQQIKLTLAPAQRDALALATRTKALVITGGPGVGKTSLVNAILKVFRAKNLDVVLCAPTGRAAKRLSETSGMEARTIHRLLEFNPASGGFKRDSSNLLEGDVFIIDETSMVDLPLAYQTVRAIPKTAALILVGDVDQLPSVGPGCVLRDIIDSGVIPSCRLTEVFRQAAQSDIIQNAHRINHGQMPVFPQGKEERPVSDFYLFEVEEPPKAIETILRLIGEAIPQKFGFRASDIQVLTPMQRGELGARNLNQVLQSALNPTGPSVQRFGWTFRVGDRVMQTVNDYEKDVFNGDIGRVESLDEEEQEMTVEIDGRRIVYDFQELDELVLAYACSIHKSQGSEYPVVIVPVHTQHYVLLQRNLLYTAITRGRKLVIIVGTRKALSIAVNRVEARQRVTSLRQRLVDAQHQLRLPLQMPLDEEDARLAAEEPPDYGDVK